MATERLTGPQIAQTDLAHWRLVGRHLRTRLLTTDFARGLEVVTAIAAAAEEAHHHPDLDLRYGHVDIALRSHDVRGITERDLALARRIDQIAAELNVASEPSAPQEITIALDTDDMARLVPFWSAVLGYDQDPDEDDTLLPRVGHSPVVWFQPSEARPGRGRIHLDLYLPHDQVEERMAAALAAGGRLVTDDSAPSWWVLADADGNEVCLCTWQPRD